MKQFIFGLILISCSATVIFGQDPNFGSVFVRGIALANRDSFAEALVEFQNAGKLLDGAKISKKTLAQLHFNIGVCYFRLESDHEAIGHFETAVRLYPKYERAHYALGMAALNARDWQKAARAFTNALKIDKTNGETWFDLAFAHLGANALDNATKAFQNSIVYKSVDSPLSHNNVGVLLAMKGDLQAAEAQFVKANELSSGRLVLARTNLEFCRQLRQRPFPLIARMEFEHRSPRLLGTVSKTNL